MSYAIDYQDSVFVVELSGNADAEAFGKCIDEMLTHEEWNRGGYWLTDVTHLNSQSLTVEDIYRIADLSRDRSTRFGHGRNALVVDFDLE